MYELNFYIKLWRSSVFKGLMCVILKFNSFYLKTWILFLTYLTKESLERRVSTIDVLTFHKWRMWQTHVNDKYSDTREKHLLQLCCSWNDVRLWIFCTVVIIASFLSSEQSPLLSDSRPSVLLSVISICLSSVCFKLSMPKTSLEERYVGTYLLVCAISETRHTWWPCSPVRKQEFKVFYA
jgi:hypothetical protein